MRRCPLSWALEGISCDHSVRAVKNALEDVQGVKSASARMGHAEVATGDDTARDVLVARPRSRATRSWVGG